MRLSWSFILGIALVLAVFLRLYQLDQVPVALFGDEIDVGYQAYSLMQTGQDIYGRTMPVYIKSLAEFRAPLMIYSTIPFIWIFGLNEWGVRLAPAFWGIVSVFGIYLLTRQLFDKKVAVLATLILAVSPWHLQYSRASFEVTMLLSFLIFGTYFFLKGLQKPKLFIFSAILFGLTPYIYSTALVFTPLLLLILVLTNKDFFLKRRKVFLYLLIPLIIVTLPALFSVVRGEARERFSVVSIFQDTVLLDKINIARKTPATTPVTESLTHNKPLAFGQVFALNYLRAFSFDFLFAQGDANFRQSIHEMGELHLYELIPLLVGLWLLIKQETKKKMLIGGWLLIAPIPAALTYDGGYHATRLIVMLPALTIIAALGLEYILERWKILALAILIVGTLNVGLYLHRYHVHYPAESWRWWQYGYSEVMNYIGENQNKYQTVVINNTYEPALQRYLFYTKYDPALFHKQFTGDRPKENIIPGVDGFTLDNHIYFGKINNVGQTLKPGMLYVASARDEFPIDIRGQSFGNFTIAKTVVSPTGEPVFYILEGK